MKRIAVFVILCTFFCAGCSAGKTEPKMSANAASQARIKNGTSKTYKKSGGPDTSHDMTENNKKSAERAKAVSKAVTDIDGIESAAVIVTGNTAVIGININGEPDDAALIFYKNQAEQAAKNADKDLKLAAVTAASDLVERITKMTGSVIGTPEPKLSLEPSADISGRLGRIAPGL